MDTKQDVNDFKVVELFNSTDFDFTPELGAMYDGRPLFVGSGERKQFPYHVGHRLAENLAKAVLVKGAPLHDPNATNPTGTPLWGDEKLKAIKSSFLTELYTEEKPIAKTQTDVLMDKVAEFEKFFEEEKAKKAQQGEPTREATKTVAELVSDQAPSRANVPKVYQDKQEVIAELDKRGIKYPIRATKAALIKLLN